MKVRILGISVCAALCVFLSSCGIIGASPEDLMVAPYPTGELQGIRRALERHVKKFTLVYPKTGSSRSAFVRRNFDGSGRELVIAFYSTETDPNTHINILCREENEWKSIYEFKSTPGKLEHVEFADLDGDGDEEIITAWSLFGAVDRQLNIFTVKSDELINVHSENYAGYVLCDLSGDGRSEVIVIRRDQAVFKAQAQVYILKDAQIVSIGSAPLDGNISDYAKISVGAGTGDAQGVFIDAYKGEGMVTDVISMKKGVPVSAFMKSTPGYENTDTWRPQPIVCSDIDGDGRIEIPFLTPLPGYKGQKPGEQAYLTTWKRYNGAAYEAVFSAVNNLTDGYYLKYPERWVGKITIVRDNENRMRTFCVWNAEADIFGQPVLMLRVFSEESWKDVSDKWLRLRTKSGFVYAAQIPESGEFTMTQAELRECFNIIE